MSRRSSRNNSSRQDESQKRVNQTTPNSQAFDTSALSSAMPQIMSNPRSASPAQVLQMQRAGGNAAVARMMSSRSQPPAIQAKKLTVGPTNDKYEQEADQVSKAVVNGQSVNAQSVQRAPQTIQRKGFWKKAKNKLLSWGGKAKDTISYANDTGGGVLDTMGAMKDASSGVKDAGNVVTGIGGGLNIADATIDAGMGIKGLAKYGKRKAWGRFARKGFGRLGSAGVKGAAGGMALAAATGGSAVLAPIGATMVGALETVKSSRAIYKSQKNLNRARNLVTGGDQDKQEMKEYLKTHQKKRRSRGIFNTVTNSMLMVGGGIATAGVATANPVVIGIGISIAALGGLLKFGNWARRKIRDGVGKVKTDPDNPTGPKITRREYKKKIRNSMVQKFYDLLPATEDLGDMKAHKQVKKAKQSALKTEQDKDAPDQNTVDDLNREIGEQDDKINPLKFFQAAGFYTKDIKKLAKRKQAALANAGQITTKEGELDNKEQELRGNPAGTGGKEQELADKQQEISDAKDNLATKKRQAKQKATQKTQKEKDLQKEQAKDPADQDANKITNLPGEIATLDNEINTLNTEVTALKDTTIPNLQQELQTIVGQINTLKSDIKVLEKEIETLQKPENKVKAKLADYLKKR